MASKRRQPEADDDHAASAKPMWEWSLPELEKHEIDLMLRVEQCLEEIAELEKEVGPAAVVTAAAAAGGSAAGEAGSAEGAAEAPEEAADANVIDESWEAPDWCVPIKANVLSFEWERLAKYGPFDVIMTDPPWQLATHAPTRGVALGYDQLPDVCIEELPIQTLSQNGLIFIWVINAKYAKAFELMKRWGYTYVDSIDWVKQTVNRRMAKGHGYYLQHAKETCLIGKKGDYPPGCKHGVGADVIFAERRGQSQKPEEIYELIEELVPNGRYLEIFARRNNLRDYWVSIGNEL